jgi:transposase-like protein
MGLALEPSVRREIVRRRRQTHDKRVADRLSAVLWVADGHSQHEVAELLDITSRQVRKWLRLFRIRDWSAGWIMPGLSWRPGRAGSPASVTA